jgi:serine/threonine protein kinase
MSNPLKLDSALGKFLPTVNKTAVELASSSGVNATNSSTPKSKQTINDYHIMNTLGSGSFGRVHLVRSKLDNKFWAMKALKKSEIVKLRQVEHTVNEKQILEELNMPFLVKMAGTFQDSNSLFIILEYIQGGELFSYLRKSGVSFKFDNSVFRIMLLDFMQQKLFWRLNIFMVKISFIGT